MPAKASPEACLDDALQVEPDLRTAAVHVAGIVRRMNSSPDVAKRAPEISLLARSWILRCAVLCAGVGLYTGCAVHPPAPAPAAVEPGGVLERFDRLIVGTFDNGAQIAAAAASREPRPARRWRIERLVAPALGVHLYWLHEQGSGGQHRHRLFRVSPTADGVAVESASLNPPRAGQTVPDVAGAAFLDGCAVQLREDGGAFVGGILPARCRVLSLRLDTHVLFSDQWRLDGAGLSLLENGISEAGQRVVGRADGIPDQLVRVLRYRLWVARRSASGEVERHTELELTTLGNRLALPIDGYAAALRVVGDEQGRSVLQLSLLRDGTTEAHAYADAQARQLGLALPAIQLGVVRMEP